MEQSKKAKFYAIIKAYTGRIYKRNPSNEVYQEKKVYNFYFELCEKVDLLWQTIESIFYSYFSPTRTIHFSFERLVAKVAFCPPKDTYALNFDQDDKSGNGELLLAQYVKLCSPKTLKGYQTTQKILKKHLECFYTYSKYGNRIACAFFKCASAQKTIVYSHTNAEDIGTSVIQLYRMRKRVQQNVFFYDYSGFGLSSGLVSERNLYADIEAAIQELCKRKSLTPKDLILFGESMGSVPTIYMATRIDAYGVILQSAFMSAFRIYFPYEGKTLLFDPFPNIERVSQIKSKTLVIHGSEDMLVDITHAVAIYRALKNPAVPFWCNGFSHMNIFKHQHYYERLKHFIDYELDGE